ncbi:hypothetical protein KGS77_24150 [Streptomyces sp. MST-110588]|nr:hypothetical protein KGS77_24150 [Streptomyces sp. MST-110588]
MPAQQNPYAQSAPYPSPGQPPAGTYGYPAPGTGLPPSTPPGGPGSPDAPGKGARGWLWALGGAVGALAMGGAVLFATGALEDAQPTADLAGYSYTSDLCAITSLTPYENAGFKTKPAGSAGSKGDNPQHSGIQQNSLDSMWCNTELQPSSAGSGSSTDYSSMWVYSAATLHKKADPTPEFADTYHAYESQKSSITYKVTQVSGIGDEAYLVTRNEESNSTSSYVLLGVRQGWMTYQVTWSSYTSSSSGKPPSTDQIADMLKNSTTETLKKLRH